MASLGSEAAPHLSGNETYEAIEGKMQMKLKMFAATALAAGTIALTSAAPASAQPIITGGLVNVVVGDVTILEDVRVGVAVQAAASVCGVGVNVLASQIGQGPVDCESTTGDLVQIIPA